MLEQNIGVGDVIVDTDYLLSPISPGSASADASRLTSEGVVDKTFTIFRSTKIKKSFGLITWTKTGETKFTVGPFRWLPYGEAKINWSARGGLDVLSGPFSGCLMSLYTEDGAERVAHVFCDVGIKDCKEQWRTHTEKGSVSVTAEFKPDDHAKGAGSQVFGLFSIDSNAQYSIKCEVYDPEVKNPLSRDEWIEYYKERNPDKGAVFHEAFADAIAGRKKIQFNEAYGQALRITGIDKVI